MFNDGNGHFLGNWNFQITLENCHFTEMTVLNEGSENLAGFL